MLHTPAAAINASLDDIVVEAVLVAEFHLVSAGITYIEANAVIPTGLTFLVEDYAIARDIYA